MAIGDPYISVADLKPRLSITGSTQDALLLGIVNAASRQIEGWTGRQFNKPASATARYFTARYLDTLDLPDVVSISEIAIDGGTRTYQTLWESTDFDLTPYDVRDGYPYSGVRVAPTGTVLFGRYPRGVRVTAVWGWPSVPAAIQEATALQASRLYKRKDAPFGVIGSIELGQLQTITKIDPDVVTLIAPYKVITV